MRILVVDDDPEILSLCVSVLKETGHQVEGVDTGEKALGKLAYGWDLLLVDVTLPGMSGLDLADKVADSADVIIMTANPALDSSLHALRAGVFDYLPKPFTIDRLIDTVRNCGERGRVSSSAVREEFLVDRLKKASQEVAGLRTVESFFSRFCGEPVSRLMRTLKEEPGHGRKMDATMLFADVRWFTPFAASVGPEAAVLAVNKLLAVVVAEVNKNGGMINKFLGDGAFALFGCPDPLPDQCAAACRAALGIVSEVEKLAQAALENGQTPLRLGLGINTGEVLAGLLGTEERMEYTVIGHAANVASRLESISRPGQILVGKDTYDRITNKEMFNLQTLGPKELPGVPGFVETWQLLPKP
ncbi:MAG: response regulator [Elusimicrobia bacterium]|nr:response regulator [Elusimicrobiota bacterium]